MKPRLVDEVVSVAKHMRRRLQEHSGDRGCLTVVNPAYPIDILTDRWPETPDRQRDFDRDLEELIVDLERLRDRDLSIAEKHKILKRHFGETAAGDAINRNMDARRVEMEGGKLQIGSKGKVFAAAIARPALTTSVARAATRSGGLLDDALSYRSTSKSRP